MFKKYYQVNPRYTPGSPAMVSRETAVEVGTNEVEAHAKLLRMGGISSGLKDIVLEYYTRFGRVWYEDMITGHNYVRMECNTASLKPGDRIIRSPNPGVLIGKVVECRVPVNDECIVVIKTETSEVMTSFNKDYRFYVEREGW